MSFGSGMTTIAGPGGPMYTGPSQDVGKITASTFEDAFNINHMPLGDDRHREWKASLQRLNKNGVSRQHQELAFREAMEQSLVRHFNRRIHEVFDADTCDELTDFAPVHPEQRHHTEWDNITDYFIPMAGPVSDDHGQPEEVSYDTRKTVWKVSKAGLAGSSRLSIQRDENNNRTQVGTQDVLIKTEMCVLGLAKTAAYQFYPVATSVHVHNKQVRRSTFDCYSQMLRRFVRFFGILNQQDGPNSLMKEVLEIARDGQRFKDVNRLPNMFILPSKAAIEQQRGPLDRSKMSDEEYRDRLGPKPYDGSKGEDYQVRQSRTFKKKKDEVALDPLESDYHLSLWVPVGARAVRPEDYSSDEASTGIFDHMNNDFIIVDQVTALRNTGRFADDGEGPASGPFLTFVHQTLNQPNLVHNKGKLAIKEALQRIRNDPKLGPADPMVVDRRRAYESLGGGAKVSPYFEVPEHMGSLDDRVADDAYYESLEQVLKAQSKRFAQRTQDRGCFAKVLRALRENAFVPEAVAHCLLVAPRVDVSADPGTGTSEAAMQAALQRAFVEDARKSVQGLMTNGLGSEDCVDFVMMGTKAVSNTAAAGGLVSQEFAPLKQIPGGFTTWRSLHALLSSGLLQEGDRRDLEQYIAFCEELFQDMVEKFPTSFLLNPESVSLNNTKEQMAAFYENCIMQTVPGMFAHVNMAGGGRSASGMTATQVPQNWQEDLHAVLNNLKDAVRQAVLTSNLPRKDQEILMDMGGLLDTFISASERIMPGLYAAEGNRRQLATKLDRDAILADLGDTKWGEAAAKLKRAVERFSREGEQALEAIAVPGGGIDATQDFVLRLPLGYTKATVNRTNATSMQVNIPNVCTISFLPTVRGEWCDAGDAADVANAWRGLNVNPGAAAPAAAQAQYNRNARKMRAEHEADLGTLLKRMPEGSAGGQQRPAEPAPSRLGGQGSRPNPFQGGRGGAVANTPFARRRQTSGALGAHAQYQETHRSQRQDIEEGDAVSVPAGAVPIWDRQQAGAGYSVGGAKQAAIEKYNKHFYERWVKCSESCKDPLVLMQLRLFMTSMLCMLTLERMHACNVPLVFATRVVRTLVLRVGAAIALRARESFKTLVSMPYLMTQVVYSLEKIQWKYQMFTGVGCVRPEDVFLIPNALVIDVTSGKDTNFECTTLGTVGSLMAIMVALRDVFPHAKNNTMMNQPVPNSGVLPKRMEDHRDKDKFTIDYPEGMQYCGAFFPHHLHSDKFKPCTVFDKPSSEWSYASMYNGADFADVSYRDHCQRFDSDGRVYNKCGELSNRIPFYQPGLSLKQNMATRLPG